MVFFESYSVNRCWYYCKWWIPYWFVQFFYKNQSSARRLQKVEIFNLFSKLCTMEDSYVMSPKGKLKILNVSCGFWDVFLFWKNRENAKTSLTALVPLFFSSIFSAMKFPFSIAASAGSYLADKVMPAANDSVDSTARSSSNVAKKSIHGTIDASAASSNWVWSWFN